MRDRLIAYLVLVVTLLIVWTGFAYATTLYSSTVTADGAQLYYHLNESSGTTASSAQNPGDCGDNNYTYTGGFTLGATGIIGMGTDTAVTLNGTTGYITRSDCPENRIPSTNNVGWSFEAWVYPTQSTSRQVVFNRSNTDTSSPGWSVQLTNTPAFFFAVNENGGGTYGCSNFVGSWSQNNYYHVVATTLGAGSSQLQHCRLYVNGSLVDSQTSSFTGNVSGNGNTASIGARGTGVDRFFGGNIDEVAFYNVELTSTQVSNHYTLGITAPATSAPLPFTVKRERLKPWVFGVDRPVAHLDVPSFIIEKLNKAFIRTLGVYEAR